MALTGLASILFGIVIFAKPGDGALVLLALIAAYALVTGIAQLIVAIGGERLLKRSMKRAIARRRSRPRRTCVEPRRALEAEEGPALLRLRVRSQRTA